MSNNPSNAQNDLGIQIPGELYIPGNRIEIALFIAASLSRGVGAIAPGTAELRGHLPDPIDIPNHIANPAVTVGLLTMFARGYNGTKPEAVTPDYAERHRRSFMYICGAFAVAANTFGEVVGYGKISTPDPYDFVYGVLGGALAYRWLKPMYITPDEVKLMKTYPEHDTGRQLVTSLIPDPIQKPQRPTNQINAVRRAASRNHHNPRGSNKKRR